MTNTVLMMDIDGTDIEIQSDGTVIALPSATSNRDHYSLLGNTPAGAIRNLENITKMIRAYEEVTVYQLGKTRKEKANND